MSHVQFVSGILLISAEQNCLLMQLYEILPKQSFAMVCQLDTGFRTNLHVTVKVIQCYDLVVNRSPIISLCTNSINICAACTNS